MLIQMLCVKLIVRVEKAMLPVGNFFITCKSLNSKNVKYPVGKFILPCMVSSDNQKQNFQVCVQSPLILLSCLCFCLQISHVAELN